MKYITITKSIVSKVALITLISITGVHTHASQSEINRNDMEQVSKTFTSTEDLLTQFVDPNNKTPFNIFLIKLRTTLQNLQRNIETTTRSYHDDVTTEIDKLMDYALQQFNILYDVFKKYNGKPANQAKDFGEEIKKQFDTEKIFGEMINRLKSLRSKAAQQGDTQLVKQIEDLGKKIQLKRNAWNAKSNAILLVGLMKRMSC